MSNKSKNKRVGMGLVIVLTCIVVAGLWAVLATPETTLAAKPDPGENPGGNVVQQDIPGKLTFDDDGSLTSDEPPEPYSDSDAGTTCFIGRRRGIWVRLSKTSDRTMNLTLGTLDPNPFDIEQEGLDTIRIDQGDDPWGEPTGIQAPGLPTDQPIVIFQVDLGIAPFSNVSGLKAGEDLDASTWLLFLDGAGRQWGLYFGRGRPLGVEDGWGGARFFTELDAAPVIVSCLTENKSWTVTSNTPGYLWYRGSKKNAPWVYVGKCNVPWSCDVEALP